jgi:hypothetical protein
MDGLILMAESLCRVDQDVSLHLTVPDAPEPVRAWAARRPEVILTSGRPQGVSGWDVKPWLLLQELSEGAPEALWLDTDMIVTRPVSQLVRQFPDDVLIVAEEWIQKGVIPVTHFWDMPSATQLPPVNSCFVRATQAHRTLLERWLRMTQDARYRAAQALPFDSRPFHLASDQVLLTALLGSEEFGRTPVASIRVGRDIAQCAGSSSYRPVHRVLDVFRGLPAIIHCLGRTPWASGNKGGTGHYLTDLADDVSPYSLAARRVAKEIGAVPQWIEPRTLPGALLRILAAYHPAIAGLPLAIPHAIFMQVGKSGTRKP